MLQRMPYVAASYFNEENAHFFANIGDKLACEDDHELEQQALEDVCGGLAIWEVGENSIFGFC